MSYLTVIGPDDEVRHESSRCCGARIADSTYKRLVGHLDLTSDDHPAFLLFLVMGQESFPILNPVVYLNYLDQSAGSDYEVTRDVSLATLGVRCAVVILVFYCLTCTGEGPCLGHSFEYPRGS